MNLAQGASAGNRRNRPAPQVGAARRLPLPSPLATVAMPMREPWEYLLQFVCVALMMCFVALKMKYDGKTADEWMEDATRRRRAARRCNAEEPLAGASSSGSLFPEW